MTVFLGNQRVRKKLLSDALQKKLPHAVLLSGPEGTGKFSFLQFLAEQILNKKREKFFPPEVMQVDELYQEGKHNGVEKLSRTSFFDQSHRKKGKKKSNTIGTEDLEVFTKHLHETVESEYKIVLLRNVERMTRESINKFLKTLEEPPEKTLFLMSASAEKKLLPTFLSRVRREYFSLVPENIIQEYLQEEGEGYSAEEKKELIHLSAGRGKFLQKMMKDTSFFEQEKSDKTEAEKIPHYSDLEKIQHAEILAKKDIKEIFETLFFLERHYRHILRGELKTKNITSLSEKLFLLERSKQRLSQNGNKRMVLENLFLQL